MTKAERCDLRHPIDCTCDEGMFEANKVGHLVVVHWEDTTNVADWQSRQEVVEFATNGAWICENVGWVVVDNDDCIVLSGRRAGKIGQFGLTERIPKRNVLAVQRLAVVEPDPLHPLHLDYDPMCGDGTALKAAVAAIEVRDA